MKLFAQSLCVLRAPTLAIRRSQAKRARWLTLGALTALQVLSSAACGVENKILGKWQSTTPDSSVLLSISAGEKRGPFWNGFSVTYQGKEYAPQYWRIRSGSDGTFLDVVNGAAFGPALDFGGVNFIDHKVIDLTSDRLVLTWDGRGGKSGTTEFKRIP